MLFSTWIRFLFVICELLDSVEDYKFPLFESHWRCSSLPGLCDHLCPSGCLVNLSSYQPKISLKNIKLTCQLSPGTVYTCVAFSAFIKNHDNSWEFLSRSQTSYTKEDRKRKENFKDLYMCQETVSQNAELMIY